MIMLLLEQMNQAAFKRSMVQNWKQIGVHTRRIKYVTMGHTQANLVRNRCTHVAMSHVEVSDVSRRGDHEK